MKKTSISDYAEFKKFCQISSEDDKIFENFKQNDEFKKILEHTSYDQGNGYIYEIMKNNNLELSKLDLLKNNDKIGGSTKYLYQEPFFEVSPSTLRYIKVLNDLIYYFGDLSKLSIVEIGIGYGGQSKIIMDYFEIEEYNYVDLPEVMNLTKRYLKDYNNRKLTFLDFNNLPDKKYDLIISNYAITECSKEIQDLYLKKIINNSKMGYVTGNDIGRHFDIQNYNKSEWREKISNSKILEELPRTHSDNFLLIFDNNEN